MIIYVLFCERGVMWWLSVSQPESMFDANIFIYEVHCTSCPSVRVGFYVIVAVHRYVAHSSNEK